MKKRLVSLASVLTATALVAQTVVPPTTLAAPPITAPAVSAEAQRYIENLPATLTLADGTVLEQVEGSPGSYRIKDSERPGGSVTLGVWAILAMILGGLLVLPDGVSVTGESCTRDDEDLNWRCVPLEDYGWGRNDNNPFDSKLIEEISLAGDNGPGNNSDPRVQEFRFRFNNVPPGCTLPEGTYYAFNGHDPNPDQIVTDTSTLPPSKPLEDVPTETPGQPREGDETDPPLGGHGVRAPEGVADSGVVAPADGAQPDAAAAEESTAPTAVGEAPKDNEHRHWETSWTVTGPGVVKTNEGKYIVPIWCEPLPEQPDTPEPVVEKPNFWPWLLGAGILGTALGLLRPTPPPPPAPAPRAPIQAIPSGPTGDGDLPAIHPTK